MEQFDLQANRIRPIFWLTFGLLCVAFFLTEHSFEISQTDSYAATADELESNAVGGNIVRRVVFFSVAALGILLFLSPVSSRLQLTSGLAICIFGFLLWAFLTTLWSADPDVTFRRSLVISCLLLGAYGIAQYFTPRELVRFALFIPLTFLVIGFLTEISLGTFRPYISEYRFSGTLHPNSQGASLASLCLASFCLYRHSKKRYYLFILLLAVVFLLLTKSRTACAGVLCAILIILTLRTSANLKWGTGITALWSVSVAVFFVLLFNWDIQQELTELALLGRQEQSGSLTGRLPIWEEMMRYVSQRPFIGYGYDSFWTPDRINIISGELEWGIKEAHSAYIDSVLSVGLVGTVILLAIVFIGIKKASRHYLTDGNPQYGYLLGMLLFGLLNAFTESGMILPSCVPFLIVIGLVQMTRRPKSILTPAFHQSSDRHVELEKKRLEQTV